MTRYELETAIVDGCLVHYSILILVLWFTYWRYSNLHQQISHLMKPFDAVTPCKTKGNRMQNKQFLDIPGIDNKSSAQTL